MCQEFLPSNDENEDFIERWSYTECENDYNCSGCEEYEECLNSARDAYEGQIIFHDMVISGGYDSEEDFWECNGI